MTILKEFTAEDVTDRVSHGDCWVIVDGIIYDVSDFSERHPGGMEVLLAQAGRDVSELMRSDAFHEHSTAAFSLLKDMRVGILRAKDQSCPSTTSSSSSVAATTSTSTAEMDTRANGNGSRHSNGVGHLSNGNGHVLHRHHAATNGNSTSLSSPRANGSSQSLNVKDFSMQGWRDEDLVDWSKPMLSQVGQLGSLYHTWVHAPVDKPLRLFHSDFVEFFSRTPWYVIPLIWLPVVAFLSVLCTSPLSLPGSWLLVGDAAPVSATSFSVLFVLGAVLWTLVEYMLHRFVFHLTPPDDWPSIITAHFLLHGQHHKVPFETMRLVFPPVPASMIAAFFYWVLRLMFSLSATQALTAGGLFGYVCYDLTHYYLHHGEPRRGTYFHRLKSYHVRHHFVNHKAGFGISNWFWDIPFRTAS
ncbi:fatty acid 2-hydroxylase-like [Sycon ciliatum]|uniref:fatty acid 2-hydroxylase-like n=1 Tax=Sycon ciliatum TaxID=27933 RepID=UPI0031F60A67